MGEYVKHHVTVLQDGTIELRNQNFTWIARLARVCAVFLETEIYSSDFELAITARDMDVMLDIYSRTSAVVLPDLRESLLKRWVEVQLMHMSCIADKLRGTDRDVRTHEAQKLKQLGNKVAHQITKHKLGSNFGETTKITIEAFSDDVGGMSLMPEAARVLKPIAVKLAVQFARGNTALLHGLLRGNGLVDYYVGPRLKRVAA
ncbi:MAG: hypothetical protein NT003_02050 [Candidatus Magasanikbacteria bacterium]|nr:hypothetical protein [Candidatus Magasanikbacteria bacterium]